MRITLLRHAQTGGNLRSNYIGVTDEPLAPAGVALARRAAKKNTVKTVHTSALKRTAETARILYPGAETVPHAELNEMNFGVFEGRNHRDLEADPVYAAWLASDCEAPCPGGESKAAFTRRCRECFLKIVGACREAGAEEAHFVVHGGVIMAVMSECAAPEREYFAWAPGFCGGYVIEDAPGPAGKFSLRETLTLTPPAAEIPGGAA